MQLPAFASYTKMGLSSVSDYAEALLIRIYLIRSFLIVYYQIAMRTPGNSTSHHRTRRDHAIIRTACLLMFFFFLDIYKTILTFIIKPRSPLWISSLDSISTRHHHHYLTTCALFFHSEFQCKILAVVHTQLQRFL